MKKLIKYLTGEFLVLFLLTGNAFAQQPTGISFSNPYADPYPQTQEQQIVCFNEPTYRCEIINTAAVTAYPGIAGYPYSGYPYPMATNTAGYGAGFAVGGGYNTTYHYNPYWSNPNWHHQKHHHR